MNFKISYTEVNDDRPLGVRVCAVYMCVYVRYVHVGISVCSSYDFNTLHVVPASAAELHIQQCPLLSMQ